MGAAGNARCIIPHSATRTEIAVQHLGIELQSITTELIPRFSTTHIRNLCNDPRRRPYLLLGVFGFQEQIVIVMGIWVYVDRHLLDLAVELAALRCIVLDHRLAVVLPDVQKIVE